MIKRSALQQSARSNIEVIKSQRSFLFVHGIICLASALLPLYPPVFIFYALVSGPFAIKLIAVLLLGFLQAVLGAYWLLERKAWRPRWYWFAITFWLIPGLLLIFPALHPPGLFHW